jgi:hypothetical protein
MKRELVAIAMASFLSGCGPVHYKSRSTDLAHVFVQRALPGASCNEIGIGSLWVFKSRAHGTEIRSDAYRFALEPGEYTACYLVARQGLYLNRCEAYAMEIPIHGCGWEVSLSVRANQRYLLEAHPDGSATIRAF